ncbi:YeiH family protein [Caulobacter sp. S45]|uniref:YeiH family protein n=1 Tax=Caulobacter sp. S45 TaxID=1641861 RepID=UPI00131B6308|nr:putative sulfate exporter family transporter [Caulobacter sp. S45]
MAMLVRLAPGVLLCGVVSLLAVGLQAVEIKLAGRAWLEALVLAILLGTAVRTAWKPGARWCPGISFSAKILLEVAVVLLGASISAATLASAGLPLLAGVAVVVALAISVSYGLGRLIGLPHRMATLIACGNSICGNSAIAAVAPVIGADGDDVATSIAFTAVLGVGVVLILPVLAGLLHMHALPFGVLAGLTVYAVPQVLAATAPVSALSVQMGTLVKLVRVLMLGPVCVVLALITAGRNEGGATRRGLPPLHHLVPWFIIGFLGLMGARSAGLIPVEVLKPAASMANILTVLSMAALGLGVDVRVVARAGARVVSVVVLSLLLLGGVAFALIRLIGLS